MNQLYRLSYVRGGKERSITFSAADQVAVAEFAAIWERTAPCTMLNIAAIGQSKIPVPPWERRDRALLGGGDRPLAQSKGE